MSDRLARLAAAADATPYHATLGMRVDALAADAVRLRIPYTDDNSNPGRALHGGVYASAIDAAGVLAAWSGVEDADALERRTLDLSVCYLAAAIGEDIVADARVLRRGKELAYVAVDVRTDAGKAVATGLVTHRMAPRGPSAREIASVPQEIAATGDVPKLARMLVAVPFIARRGMQITHMRDGTARVEMPWAADNADPDGHAHEGAVAALLDTAGAMASWSIVGLDFRYKASTVAIHASFHAPAAGEAVVAHARTLRRANESFVNAVTASAGGRTIATGSVTYRIVVPV
jgi:uncharacterized protein (TIGR00369 family)